MKPEREKQLSESGCDISPLKDEERERPAAELTEEERYILIDHGTEPAICGKKPPRRYRNATRATVSSKSRNLITFARE